MNLLKINLHFQGLARAVIANYHRLGGSNNGNVLLHSSGGWKSEITVVAGLVSSEAAKVSVLDL